MTKALDTEWAYLNCDAAHLAHQYELSPTSGEVIAAKISRVFVFDDGVPGGHGNLLDELLETVIRYKNEEKPDFVERVYNEKKLLESKTKLKMRTRPAESFLT